MITSFHQLDLSKRYTYADYLTWQFEDFVELLRGKVVKMPAPTTLHQSSSSNLHFIIKRQMVGNPCKVFAAPFDVRLPLPAEQMTPDKQDTVVQPDLCVVCDLTKLDRRGCNGAPDWIIEILSKSTAAKDLNEKFSLYQSAGVKEYWAVHPEEETILTYHLQEDGLYQISRQTPYTNGESINSFVFPELSISVAEAFE